MSSNPSGASWSALLDRDDRAVADVDDAVVDDALLVVHRHDPAAEREGRPVERIDGNPRVLAQEESLGATQISVRPSSGLGRETQLLCLGRPRLPAASSPRNSGTPNGRSRLGIGA